MSEQNATNNEGLNTFVQVLKETEEKVRNINKSENRTFRMINGWDNPPLTQVDLANKIRKLRRYVERHSFIVTESAKGIQERLESEFKNWSNDPLRNVYSGSAARVCYSLDCLLEASYSFLKDIEDTVTIEDLQADYKKELERINALRGRLDSAESDTGDIDEVIERIQDADRTAQSLPETLSSLRRARTGAQECSKEAQEYLDEIQTYHSKIEKFYEQINSLNEQASKTLDESKKVLASATSAGLAHAFNERKEELQEKGTNWTIALAVSLGLAVLAIWLRSDAIFKLLEESRQTDAITLIANFFISIAFIGAPIWFAWLSTKQVGYYFRLSEDYGFKAAVSTSYEGFRNQVAMFDKKLERKVLASTLERYDEPPLRFVDERVVGSPYHEILTSPDFKEAVKSIPDFAREVLDFTKDKLKVVNKTSDTAEKIVEKIDDVVDPIKTKE